MVKYSSFAQRSAKHLDYDGAIRFQEQALEIIAELHGLHILFEWAIPAWLILPAQRRQAVRQTDL